MDIGEKRQKSQILASIIIPIYNSAEYLQQCLDSVVELKASEIEIILVNDGSTDNSMEICFAYAERDSRIQVLTQKNEGVSCARNTGIETAAGIWVTFVDSDDLIIPFVYENTIKHLAANPFTDMLLMKMTTDSEIPPTHIHSVSINHLSKQDLNTLCCGILDLDNKVCKAFRGFSIISPCAKFYSRQILIENDIRFNKNVAIGEDRIFNYTYLGCIEQADCVDDYGYIYVQNSNSVMHTYKPNKGIQMLDSLKIFYDLAEVHQYEIAQYGIRQYISALKLDFCHPENPKRYADRRKEALALKKHPLIKESFARGSLLHLKPVVAVVAFFAKINLFCICDLLLRTYYKKRLS